MDALGHSSVALAARLGRRDGTAVPRVALAAAAQVQSFGILRASLGHAAAGVEGRPRAGLYSSERKPALSYLSKGPTSCIDSLVYWIHSNLFLKDQDLLFFLLLLGFS